jgi:hypothetical protein
MRDTLGVSIAGKLAGGSLILAAALRLSAAAEAAPPAAAQPEQAPAKASAPATLETIPPPQLQAWVRELDDDRYAVRKAAQKSLTAIGAPALNAVGDVAAGGTLESSTRAVNVLSTWAESPDRELRLRALEQLAALKGHPAEAAAARERLAEIREQEAIAAIRELGGFVVPDRQMTAMVGPTDYLQVIIGPQWKGGVDGLRHASAIRRARTLSLHSSPIDDSALPILAELTHVARIEIYGTPSPISPEGVVALRGQLPPAVLIDVRGGARLGIRGQDVQQVVAGSPAAKAGVKEGDRIVEFDGVAIEDFDQLTAQIAKAAPGDTKSLHVLRVVKPGEEPKRIELRVTFDRWGDDPQAEHPADAQNDPFGAVEVNGPRRVIIPQRR